ncbi:dipeptidase [Phaeovulum vinaykumarii]|uniref:Membrane dipeptidase n=1 Tax=Phaeovulum vinaykumarii TaxID=407234 RepID=A0A1N7L3I0_9RHOB|nr:dipeptidase [Phaeovulum vinaykumarii]SIS68364.1 membrane dipeptidase [Phaeovulum vinaykumarii]SOC00130.1 membrane dipeptidase [Phaeovulum vinaykumarii]
MQPVFDGHNDLLLHLWQANQAAGEGFFAGRPAGQIDLDRARQGGFAGGLFACFVPNPPGTHPDPQAIHRAFDPIDPDMAAQAVRAQLGIARAMAAARPQDFALCQDVAAVTAAQARGAVAAVLHVEGAEGIGPDLAELHHWHALGLRSLGPTWSRPNIFGHGVPFAFPSSPDLGPGLTDAGRRLVRACDALGIALDVSHLNEAGFWDLMAASTRPVMASHAASHAMVPASRNLTDRQLAALAERGGIVGLNFSVNTLRADGLRNPALEVEVLARHLEHLLGVMGEGGVGFGSDFDGTVTPWFLRSVADLPQLLGALARLGFGRALIARIAWQNWLAYLGRVLPAPALQTRVESGA